MEKATLESVPGRRPPRSPGRTVAGPDPNALELALDYANAGLWPETADILEPRVAGKDAAPHPLSAYLHAYVQERMGRMAAAQESLRQAAALPPDLVFPYALEFIDIFEWAMTKNPADARAPYYLGNLLFDLQPERAIACWERSRSLDPAFGQVHRNLGLAYARVKNDVPAAVASLERAVALDPKDARFYYELDVLYEAAGMDPVKRLALLEKNHAAVSANDNALAREVGLLLPAGRPSRAVEILKSHHFHVWEGGGEIHGLWVEANLAAGRGHEARKDLRRALEAYQGALEYPANLDVGPPSSGPGSPKVFFHIGRAQAALGHTAEAESSFEKGAAFGAHLSEQSYYRGLALEALGRSEAAVGVFAGLAKQAREALAVAPAMDFFEKFGERQSARTRQANLHFLAGLGLLGQEKAAAAKAEFEKALSLDPGHLEARRFTKQTAGAKK
jgi:tetratricopeptide (TPR) repeat protein